MTQDTDPHTDHLPYRPVKHPLPKHMRARLEETLAEEYSSMPDGVMVEQARILDRIFRHLTARGVEYGDTQVFQAAFRAQNQYRMTVKSLETLDLPRGGAKKT